jgi:hypothetical protein
VQVGKGCNTQHSKTPTAKHHYHGEFCGAKVAPLSADWLKSVSLPLFLFYLLSRFY